MRHKPIKFSNLWPYDFKPSFGLIIKLLRVKHWSKSAFVFIGVIFSGQWHSHYPQMLLAAFAFCLLSSAVYIYNDIKDLKYDSLHPLKKSRPIASGQISCQLAGIVFCLFAATSLIIASFISKSAVVILTIYFVINVLYSNYLKHIVYIDVFCIGSGFMLRILMGTLAIKIEPSIWLLLCGTFLSLFLGFSKRLLELELFQKHEGTIRPVLIHYTKQTLNSSLWSTAIASILSYMAYLIYMIDNLNHPLLMISSLPIVIAAFIRYSMLIKRNRRIVCPVTLFFSDNISILNLGIFLAVIFIVMY